MQRQWTKLIIEPIFSFPGTAFPLLIFRALSLPFLSHKVPFTPSSSIKYFSFPGTAALDEQKSRLKELFGVEFLRANEQEKWSEEVRSSCKQNYLGARRIIIIIWSSNLNLSQCRHRHTRNVRPLGRTRDVSRWQGRCTTSNACLKAVSLQAHHHHCRHQSR